MGQTVDDNRLTITNSATGNGVTQPGSTFTVTVT